MSRPFHFSAVLVNDGASIRLPSQGSSLQLMSLFIICQKKEKTNNDLSIPSGWDKSI